MAEDRLARVMREEVMKSLAEAKLQLAQADFEILELQVLSLVLLRWYGVNILARKDCNIIWAWAEHQTSWLSRAEHLPTCYLSGESWQSPPFEELQFSRGLPSMEEYLMKS